MKSDYDKCIDCGRCTRECVFLSKYSINLKDYANMKELAFNCYLCDRCMEVCPVDISGAEISIKLREVNIAEGYDLNKNGYGVLIREKKDYIFKNYRGVSGKTAFFPGCNFPAYFPDTSKKLIKLLKNDFNIDTIFDCCGKPIADLRSRDEGQVNLNFEERMEKLGIEELVVVCPNCYNYLKNTCKLKISMLYDKDNIMENLVKSGNEKIKGKIFIPCPDRKTREIYSMLETYIKDWELEEIEDIQCCGAGACAGLKEGQLSKNLQDSFNDYDEDVFVYCATCAGMIKKSKENVYHILCRLLGEDEKISEGFKTIKNRALFCLFK